MRNSAAAHTRSMSSLASCASDAALSTPHGRRRIEPRRTGEPRHTTRAAHPRASACSKKSCLRPPVGRAQERPRHQVDVRPLQRAVIRREGGGRARERRGPRRPRAACWKPRTRRSTNFTATTNSRNTPRNLRSTPTRSTSRSSARPTRSTLQSTRSRSATWCADARNLRAGDASIVAALPPKQTAWVRAILAREKRWRCCCTRTTAACCCPIQWDRKDASALYTLAILKDPALKSVRDLRGAHCRC